ncbi:hypothetical protein PS662_00289 [Pseudomonas fluorescens]|uniref:DUF3077 domain-containing protein n=1 Tax=Pseudomonas fluorescens TaxID=294 RepID=A0A5E6PIQ7_PSEFL|nr:DUF6124 family protein [Pseudomonas fluorescens]VVM41027.1 hypothetical protein PS662_00289 [Pseudomonas fluorescens]
MPKVTPNPPENDPTSHSEQSNSTTPSAADIQATPRTPSTMYVLNPQVDTETLLGDACESLASAHVMTLDLADRTHGPSRNTLLGIAQVIMLSELNVNRALDQLDPIA